MTEKISHKKEIPSRGKRGPTATNTSMRATPELETAGRLLLQKVTELMELDTLCIWTQRPETLPYVRKEVVINSDQTAIPPEKHPSRQKPCQL